MLRDALSRRAATPPPRATRVALRGGFAPAVVHGSTGEDVRIVFRRAESDRASECVVFPTLGKMVTLPRGADVRVDLGRLEPGRYEFTCGSGAARGAIVVATTTARTTGGTR